MTVCFTIRRDLLRMALALAALAVCVCASNARAATPADRSTPAACETAAPGLAADVPTSFAYDLDSAPILDFITALKHASKSVQKSVFNAGADFARSPRSAQLDAAEKPCLNAAGAYATARAYVLIAKRWSAVLDGMSAERIDNFSAAVATEINALSMPGRLAADQLAAAAAPFAGLPAPAAQRATAPEESGCALPDEKAATLEAVAPVTPSQARNIAATVDVLLALTARGEVRSARIYRDTIVDQPAADDLRNNAIVAAASGIYSTGLKNCRRSAGTFVFEVQYRVRR